MQKRQTIILYSILFLCVIGIIPFFMLAQYAHPSADDYAYSLTTHEVWKSTGNLFYVIWEAVKTSVRYWNKWQGLYTSAFLLALQPGIFGEQYYCAGGFLVLGMMCISNFIFSWYVLHVRLKERKLLAVTVAMVWSFLMLNWFPSTEEGIYWYNGAMNYTFFMGILLFVLCLLIDLCKKQSAKAAAGKILLGSILAVALSGGNHVTAFSGLLLTAAILFFVILKKPKDYGKRIAVICVFQAVGLFCNLLAPGTAARQSALGGSHGILWSILQSLLYIFERFERWTGLELLVFMILLLPYFWNSSKKVRERSDFLFSYPLLVLIGSVGFLTAMMFPTFYAMGVPGSERVINMPYMAFIILCFFNEYYLCGWLCGKLQEKEIFYSRSWVCTTFMLLMGMTLGCYDTMLGYEAFLCVQSGEAGLYSQEADARYNLMLQSEGEDLIVTAYSVYPRLLFLEESDIGSDIQDEKNLQAAKYFNLNSIQIQEK